MSAPLIRLILSLGLLIAPRAVLATSTRPVARLALFVGSNDGGPDRVRLVYSHSDTRSASKVLQELGGVEPSRVFMLLEPGLPQITAMFERIKKAVSELKAAGNQVQVIFYYSGHSDDTALLPGGRRLEYRRLRQLLRELGGDVTIGILDSCASGAITRAKGGKWVPSFLANPSEQATGEVFLTSSSASENSQESDKLQGSYFTHYFISGLRGAADVNNDQKITLNEAYQYAFKRTLSSTEATHGGPQHPNYAFQLAGTGDLVVTELTRSSAQMSIPAEVLGHLFVRDTEGRLVAEVIKSDRVPVILALRPGTYSITFLTGTRVRQGRIVMGAVRITLFDVNDLTDAPAERARRKGGAPRTFVPASISLTPLLSVNRLFRGPTRNVFALNLLFERAHDLYGLELSGLWSHRDGDITGLQIAGLANTSKGHVEGLQIAGLANTSKGHVEGLQIASLANISAGAVTGLQIAGLANIAGGDLTGLQIAGLANIAGGDLTGLQIAGLFNHAREVSGLQLGVVNRARNVRGLQLGVVNIANDSTFSLGLINLVRNGRALLGGTVGTLGTGSLEFKHGGRNWHMIYLFTPKGENDEARWYRSTLIGAGLGVHFPVTEATGLDLDAFTRNGLVSDDLYTFSTLRLSVLHRIAPGLFLSLGAGLHVLVYEGDRQGPDSLIDAWVVKDARDNPDLVEVRLYPEITAGLFYQF